MTKIAQLVIDGFSAAKLKFDVNETSKGDILVRVPYNGLSVSLFFTGEYGEYLSLYFIIDSVPKGKEVDVVLACNSLNKTYKWLKFYLDDDNDIFAEDDAILTESNAFEETMELLARALKIIEDAKPKLMRAIFSN